MTALTFTPSLIKRLTAIKQATGKTEEEIISEALSVAYPQLRPIPNLPPEDVALFRDIEEKTDYTLNEFYARWGIEAK